MFRRHRWLPLALAALLTVGATFSLFVLDLVGVIGSGDHWSTPPSPAAASLLAAITADTLEAFESPDDFDDYVERLGRAARIQHEAERASRRRVEYLMEASEEAESAAAPESAGESITNTQEVGVDEGGIVKAHGEHLVVLRRGRLFTVHLGEGGALTPVSRIDAYPPGVDGGWYDEMLISGDTIVVIGFNWSSSGTEIGRFHIDDDGQLSRIDTHYLSSDDYYSSRNYASRLIGDSLIFYMPYSLLRPSFDDGSFSMDVHFPGTRPADEEAWNSILDSNEIVRPVQPTAEPVLHTVVTCDLSQPTLRCRARGMLGPASRSFYVSRDAVYVWVSPDRWGRAADDRSAVVYRLPLDGTSPVGAVRASGTPIDQFSFREADGFLSVLVRSDGGGDAMWDAEADGDALALMRVPLSAFTDGVTQAPSSAFTVLPYEPGGLLHVRHVDDHVLYGGGSSYWGDEAEPRPLFVHSVASGDTTRVALPHDVNRLDRLGPRGVAIGVGEGGLHFSAIDLGATPRLVGEYVQAGARQGESRSHGFFYKPVGPDGGTLGLPIRYQGGRWSEYAHGSAGVLFLDVANGPAVDFTPRGTIDASGHVTEDECVASCTDWYGNARPIFYRGRVFALLGYELVEGRFEDGDITEVARTNLFEDQGQRSAPSPPPAGATDAGAADAAP